MAHTTQTLQNSAIPDKTFSSADMTSTTQSSKATPSPDPFHGFATAHAPISRAAPATPDRSHEFKCFARLPTEVQLLIWKYAAPNPRSIGNAILVIVNGDLRNPKAILPSSQAICDYRESRHNLIRHLGDKPEIWSHWSTARRSVLSFLHTCQLSRLTILDIFCLDLPSPAPFNTRLWNPDDTLFLTTTNNYFRSMLSTFLTTSRSSPFAGLATATNVAVPLDMQFLTRLRIWRPAVPRAGFPERVIGMESLRSSVNLLTNLPAVQTITLFRDPVQIAQKEEGGIVLFETEPVSIAELRHWKAPNIQIWVEKRFNTALESSNITKRGALEVEVKVLGWERPHK